MGNRGSGMKIAIGADHRGYKQKNDILTYFREYPGIELIDVGAHDDERSDYPIFAQKVAKLVQQKEVDLGILLCGSGIGMAIAANRYEHIYAGVAWSAHVARNAKEHDDVNILVIPSDYVADDEVILIISTWLKAAFFGGRYQERLALVDNKA